MSVPSATPVPSLSEDGIAARKSYKRLSPDDRRRQIVVAAVTYFSEHGFEGSTRGLADQLGITQPLIYRYFSSKKELVRAVYEEVYLSRWRGEWIGLLGQRDLSLRERLIAFYEQFTTAVFEPEWMRIYLFSGLRGLDINRWWITFVEEHVLRRICEELRIAAGLPGHDDVPISRQEIESYWLFHGGIFYFGIRRDVYGMEPRIELKRFIEQAIDSLLDGFPATMAAAFPGNARLAGRRVR